MLDASAIVEGDGGEIVVWSDISNPESVTSVAGLLLAKGGRKGGDGGDIETSGFELDVAGIDVDATAREGEQGLWLLDPFDYTLGSIESSTISSVLTNGGDVTISTAASSNAVGSGSVAASGSESANAGTITVDSSIVVSGSGSGKLSLIADKDIQVNASLQNLSGSGDLTLSSKTGVAINSGGSIDWDGGSSGLISISASQSGGLTGSGPIAIGNGLLVVSQGSNSGFGGIVSGSGGLQKNEGNGGLTLTNNHTYTGTTEVRAGQLVVQGSLSDSTVVDVSSGATYQLAAADTIGGLQGAGTTDLNGNGLAVNIANASTSTTFSGVIAGLGSGSSLNKSGSGTLKLSGTNTYEGGTSVSAGVLEISNASALGATSRGVSSSATSVDQGAALHIVGGASTNDFSLTEQLALGSSSGSGEAVIKLVSGSAVITNPFELAGDSAIEALSGELLLDDTTASSGAAMIALGSSCGLSNTCNLRIGGNSSGGSGTVKTFLDSSAASGSDGINLGSQNLTINNNGIFRISGASTVSGELLIDSGDLQLAHVDALQSSQITLQNQAKMSFLTDFPETSPSAYSPDIVTLGTGDQTLFVESGRTVVLNDVTFTGSGNFVKDGGGTLAFYDTSNGGLGVLGHTGTTTTLAGTFQTVNPAYASSSSSPAPVLEEELITEVDETSTQSDDSLTESTVLTTTSEQSLEPTPLAAEPEADSEDAELESDAEGRGLDLGLVDSDNEEEVIGSILLAQGPTDQAPMSSSASVGSGGAVAESAAGVESTAGGTDSSAELDGADPAALTPPSMSGDGYEVSLSLDSAFQMSDSGDSGSSSQATSATSAEAGSDPASGDGGGGAESRSSDGEGSETADAGESDGGDDGGDDGADSDTSEGDEGGAEDSETSEGDEDGAEDSAAANGEAAEKEGAKGDGTKRARPKAPSPAVAINRVDSKRASQNLAKGDAAATSRTLRGLNLPNMIRRSTPTPSVIVNSLQQVRQRIMSGQLPR